MENVLGENNEIPHIEYTFPDFMPSSECKQLLNVVKEKRKPHIILFWLSFGAIMAFMILTMVLFLTESFAQSGHYDDNFQYVYDYKANYTGAIICAVFTGILIILGIVNFVFCPNTLRNLII